MDPIPSGPWYWRTCPRRSPTLGFRLETGRNTGATTCAASRTRPRASATDAARCSPVPAEIAEVAAAPRQVRQNQGLRVMGSMEIPPCNGYEYDPTSGCTLVIAPIEIGGVIFVCGAYSMRQNRPSDLSPVLDDLGGEQ